MRHRRNESSNAQYAHDFPLARKRERVADRPGEGVALERDRRIAIAPSPLPPSRLRARGSK
jgi:hypothetical protein